MTPEHDALLKALVERYGRTGVQKSLDALAPKIRGRPTKNTNLAIYHWLMERQRENEPRVWEAIRAGATREEIAEIRRPPPLIEAARAVMPGATKAALKQAVKRYDGFMWDGGAKRGWGKGQFYK
jgi:hypothetical protein